ncbi:hypothetical protein ZIOFF_076155 [Zingiber officinale]|uniref:ZCF37 n=1 Tax=Zingiber officinale TaxID=94328 RepID=A0A8J5B842_ZINOF|nr:hypothetical protein ZIOFF_076155 [Zingiber officinale]
MWRCFGKRSLRRKSVDLKEEDPWTLKSTSPKKSRKKAAAKDNRYSSLGLDKFSSLLSDLQARRAAIAVESEHKPAPMLIWFRFSDSNDCVPIVLRLNDETKQFGRLKNSPEPPPPPPAEEKKTVNEVDLPPAVSHKGGGWSWRPKYQWPLVLVLILVCLMFARTFAILCTTVWWHMVPSMQGGEGRKQRRRVKKKKIHSNDIL